MPVLDRLQKRLFFVCLSVIAENIPVVNPFLVRTEVTAGITPVQTGFTLAAGKLDCQGKSVPV